MVMTVEETQWAEFCTPELARALLDFKQGKDSGVVEIHFSQGGIAKVFAKVTKTYK